MYKRTLFKLNKKAYLVKHIWNKPIKEELDLNYLLNTENIQEIQNNILSRKGVGNIGLVHELLKKVESTGLDNASRESLQQKLHAEMLKIPSKTHPDVTVYGDVPKVVKTVGEKRQFTEKPYQFDEICKRLKLLRLDQLGNVCGSKSYYLTGEMAELETALINYVLANLFINNFQLVSVPDILPRDIIEGCGMPTRGQRTQVYTLDEKKHGPDLCLSGTSEMALGGFLANQTFKNEQLPIKLAAVSRCYRAETSNIAEERGIYRVHEFTKVEMFAVTKPEDSDSMLEEIRTIQEQIFESLELHFVVLDMPPHELGAQAYRKYDLEAWLCGRGIYGEISSCSNCTDFQSRRLGIRYDQNVGGGSFVHTLNGTACAIPRLLIALIENNQNKNGTISIPKILRKYINGKEFIGKQTKIPELKLIKNKTVF